MTLNRDELEREIVNYDKQKLITECLKLFDSNVGLVDRIGELRGVNMELLKQRVEYKEKADRLELRTLWQVLNERIALRIEKIRKRRESVNYPMK